MNLIKMERLTGEYRERFGEDPPYNMEDPEEHMKRMQEALEKDEPMPDEDVPDGVDI